MNNNTVQLKHPPGGNCQQTRMMKSNVEKKQQPSSTATAAGSGGVLPSFNDILWCTDVDGDVMTSGIDVAVVSFLLFELFFSSRK